MRFPAILLTIFLLNGCTDEPVKEAPAPDSGITQPADTAQPADTVAIDTTSKTNGTYDCSVLRRAIPDVKYQKQISRDIAQLKLCGVDSFDFLYVVPNLFPGYASENQVAGKTVTYGDFVSHLNDFRKTNAYYELHMRVVTLDSLKTVPFESKKIYSMKPVLGRLGFTEQEWNMFSGFVRTYPIPEKQVFTWGDMLEEFEKYNNTAPQQ
jgi:hypothetical protein